LPPLLTSTDAQFQVAGCWLLVDSWLVSLDDVFHVGLQGLNVELELIDINLR